jgi:hypothetical protein
MFSNYYEIEKMIQIRLENAVNKAQNDRLTKIIRNRKRGRRVKKTISA